MEASPVCAHVHKWGAVVPQTLHMKMCYLMDDQRHAKFWHILATNGVYVLQAERFDTLDVALVRLMIVTYMHHKQSITQKKE